MPARPQIQTQLAQPQLAPKQTRSPNSKGIIVDSTIYMTLIFLCVVLFLHHGTYTVDYLWKSTEWAFNPYVSKFDKVLQKIAVGGFLFLSGYKLSLSKASEPAGRFILNRLKRIYPLYFLAVCAFSFTVYPDLQEGPPLMSNFVVHALALQSVLPDLFQKNFYTIWFVSNLFCCYVMFLGLRKSLGNRLAIAIRFGVYLFGVYLMRQIAAVYGVQLFSGYFDLYLIFFSAGMLCSSYSKKQLGRVDKRLLLGLSVISIALLLVLRSFYPSGALLGHEVGGYILERVLNLGGALPIYVLLLGSFQKVTVTWKVARLMEVVSVASYCIFLFHRPIWTLLSQLWSGNSYIHSLFMLGFGIPLIVIVSYRLQLFYNQRVMPVLKKSS